MRVGILIVTLSEKYLEGGWVTAAITCLTIALCFRIRRQYREVAASLKGLERIMEAAPLRVDPRGWHLRADAPSAPLSRFAALRRITRIVFPRSR